MPRKIIRFVSLLLLFCLFFEQSGLAQVAAELNLGAHLSNLHNSAILPEKPFRPLHLRYLSYEPLQNSFRLLLDKGDEYKEHRERANEYKDCLPLARLSLRKN